MMMASRFSAGGLGTPWTVAAARLMRSLTGVSAGIFYGSARGTLCSAAGSGAGRAARATALGVRVASCFFMMAAQGLSDFAFA